MKKTFAKRIIPCLDVKDGRVVKGTNFVGLRDAGSPTELAERYDKERADELVFLDITASNEERNTMIDVVSDCASKVFIPLTVGGGIRSTEDMHRMLNAGADKVSVRIAELLSEKAFSFTPQEYISIHRKLFAGIYSHAGRLRDYNITKQEWVLDGASVLYGSATELRATLDYDFSEERKQLITGSSTTSCNTSCSEIRPHIFRSF